MLQYWQPDEVDLYGVRLQYVLPERSQLEPDGILALLHGFRRLVKSVATRLTSTGSRIGHWD